ncbi:M23 family metallopeptidase [Lacisediminihabitans changchengi]|uniref:Peptidoglycan DD-metalloendopeptidase family protein n=1 Tax=Lacisediminihabitans changchengi TaxID=2787634 RepID=A0A934W0S8_9MICO|nr:peptidoglycan DD-metalloendopeptidase family protein [Lacisediminihabitans changchengi]MBK4346158.1 peptidoglycan DD-metalloendopeptidase family protein [Lacisediminihabitans changchengi]
MSSPSAAARPIRLVGWVILSAVVLATVVLVSPGYPARAVSPETATPTVDARAGTTARVTSARWSWPIPAPHPVVRPFVAPATSYGAGHRGIDVGAASETTVLAPADGVVFFSGVVVDRPVLSITHDGGLVSSYEPVASTLPAGTAVTRGSEVGTLLPGHCAETCLHIGVRLHGEYVSPLNYLGGVPRAVLLPTRATPPASRLSLSDAQPP